MRNALLALLAAAPLVLAPAAAAGEPATTREIVMPRDGYSLKVPVDWKVEQYVDVPLEISGPNKAQVGVGPGWVVGRPFEGMEYVTAVRTAATGERIGLRGAWAEGDETGRAAVAAILQSFDARPFRNPRLHVDWVNRWSMEVPEGWRLVDGHLRHARFESPDLTAAIVVKARADEPEAKPPPEGWLAVAGSVSDRLRATLLVKDGKSEHREAGSRALETLTPETAGAAQRGTEELPKDRFEREDAPAVVFRVPSGWTATPPTNAMRLAQYRTPGDPSIEFVVYFFGAGGGGTVDDNVARWKRQVSGGSVWGPSRAEIADGMKVTFLGSEGTYVSDRPGSGPTNVPNSRQLAAILECPGGPIFVRAIGPNDAVRELTETFISWLASFRRAPAR